MSWHARWGKKDPFSKPANAGDRFGCWIVVRSAASDPHYGLRAVVRCATCGIESTRVLAQLRHMMPPRHRGCGVQRPMAASTPRSDDR